MVPALSAHSSARIFSNISITQKVTAGLYFAKSQFNKTFSNL
jgi:hypothetical protein